MVSLSFRSQNKLKGRPHIKTIGIPKHNEMGIKFEDILENNILRNLKNRMFKFLQNTRKFNRISEHSIKYQEFH